METKSKYSKKDFEFLGTVGKSIYGRVERAKHIEQGREYAIKIIEKIHLKKDENSEQKERESELLSKNQDHIGILKLYASFEDSEFHYYVMEYCPNGDMAHFIDRFAGPLPFELARFYAGELVNILEFMRSKSIIHRDIKPKNILLAADSHLRLSEFGSAKLCDDLETAASQTFVGTADYIAPEVLDEGEITYSIDLWALGCIIYQMLVGKPPFSAATQYMTFDKIRNGAIEFPPHLPPFAIDLIQSLLLPDPSIRIGGNDIVDLKSHIFFQGLDIDCIFSLTVPDYSHHIRQIVMPRVILQGIVRKKAGWIYKKRLLIISEEPRISYYEPNGEEYRGDIAISPELKAEAKGRSEFHIITPNRTYYFKELNDQPEKWVQAVSELVSKIYE